MSTHNARKALALALLAALAVAGCDRNVTGANANAPGSPGTGNPPVVTAPVAADTPPGGSSGMVGTAPNTGSSGGNAVPGTTGRGTSEVGARSQAAQPGIGTAGGLGGSSGLGMTGSFPAAGASTAGQGGGPALAGSTNSTPSSAAGNR